ncbi:MAG: GNAT family N-acetyltransferase [Acidimicrobiia bacterium]|nr:GNAT family N-acetyltransferase [Acidimicrobiia bacterium]
MTTLVDLEPGDPRLEADVLPVLRELRPHLTAASFAAVYEQGHSQGLRFTAAYLDGHCVGAAGWRIVANTSALLKLYVDDLVTTESARSQGVGRELLAELARRARAAGCKVFDLDSGVQRADAHRFYMREGLTISSFHFATGLD